MELCDKGLRWNMYESRWFILHMKELIFVISLPKGNGFEKTLIARVNLLFINPSPTLKSTTAIGRPIFKCMQ